MDINELLSYLDLDSPADFEYFEHLADLLELEEQVSHDACYQLFSQVSAETLNELIANYFEEIMENMPDDTLDIYTLLTTIRQCLLGLARSIETAEGRRQFCEEFMKFRSWYSCDSVVHCKRLADGLFSDVTVCEALALSRLEKLNEDEYDYDFTDCLDYEVDEYSMSLSDLLPDYGGPDHHSRRDCACGCDHDHSHEDEEGGSFDAFSEGLVDPENPVIDGEYEDEVLPENIVSQLRD